MTAPATATEVAKLLIGFGRDLHQIVQQLEAADRDMVEKRAAADLAFSRAFMAAEGSVEARRHLATIETHRQRLEAEVADALVRHLRRRLDATKTQVDIGRTWASALTSELALTNMGVDP